MLRAVVWYIKIVRQGLLGEFVVAAEYVGDLVLVELCHEVASWTTVLAGVEFAGFLIEYFAYSGGEGQTAIAVDVDLANGTGGCLAKLLFGDTYCIG